MSQSCLCPEASPAPPASLGRNSRLGIFILDAGMWHVFSNVSREHRWGSDGASLENASDFSQDPIGYRAGDENLYRYVGNSPLDRTDPSGQWTADGVRKLLCSTSEGRAIVGTLATVNVYKSEYVRSYYHTRTDQKSAWGDWQVQEWGGMRDGSGVHIPASYSDAQAAALLAHEGTHVGGGDELAAYIAETKIAIGTSGLTPRLGFTKKCADGTEVPDVEAIKKFIKEAYVGWYENDPLKEYKKDASGNTVVEYGKQTLEGGWSCK